ncbi:unnamed protein product [Arabidopsis thaliana]|uniref:(thale cress) hypothetical protein n=1 Tax=Arabidopsis thaliana TaxID=3702 RepID=A0A7G2FAW8_ARATH|nr:unnamed protein product [Arabidopsis thaliana]
MSYEKLLLRVRTEFELDGLGLKPKISYWLPCQLSVFAVNSRPPVMITSNISIQNFLTVKETAMHLNLLLSFKHERVEDVGMRMRQLCSVPAAKANDIGGDDIDENKFSRVRRRLFGDNEASCSNATIGFLSVETTAPGTCMESDNIKESGANHVAATDQCGIIKLEDADTPSLSHHSKDINTSGPEFVQQVLSDEDDDFLREVEAVENRENHVRMFKGKGKCKECVDDIVKNASDDSYTNGVGCSGSDVDIFDEDIWTLAFDREYPIDFSPSG